MTHSCCGGGGGGGFLRDIDGNHKHIYGTCIFNCQTRILNTMEIQLKIQPNDHVSLLKNIFFTAYENYRFLFLKWHIKC